MKEKVSVTDGDVAMSETGNVDNRKIALLVDTSKPRDGIKPEFTNLKVCFLIVLLALLAEASNHMLASNRVLAPLNADKGGSAVILTNLPVLFGNAGDQRGLGELQRKLDDFTTQRTCHPFFGSLDFCRIIMGRLIGWKLIVGHLSLRSGY